MEKQNTAWYVARRGELLAEEFLLDLQPDNIVANPSEGAPVDFVAFFTTRDHIPVTIGVTVKATQKEINGNYSLAADQARRLLHSNLPVLIVVIDVKANEIYFNWIRDAIPLEKQADLGVRQVLLHLRKSSEEERRRLRDEILADPIANAA